MYRNSKIVVASAGFFVVTGIAVVWAFLGSPRETRVSLDDLLPGSWEYSRIEGARQQKEYLFTITLQQDRTRPENEIRVLMDYAGPDSFCCLRLKDGKARFLKVKDGFEAPLEGNTRSPLSEDVNGLKIDIFRAPGHWIVAWGGRDRILAIDPEPLYGPVAIGTKGSITVAQVKIQPLGPIHFRDDFSRTSFVPDGLYEIWSGSWDLKKMKDTERSVNAFQALAESEEEPCIAVFGYPFWRRYKMSASLLYKGNGSAGLVFGVSSRKSFGLVEWKRSGCREGKLEIIEHTDGHDRLLESLPWVPRSDQWYRLTLEMFGETARLCIGGEEVLFRVPPTIRRGRCGLFAASADGVVFDDVSCDSLRVISESPEPQLTKMLKERRLFEDRVLYFKKDGERIGERHYRDLDSWLNDDRNWERGEGYLRQKTLFWDTVFATADVVPPENDGEILLEMRSPDTELPPVSVGIGKKFQNRSGKARLELRRIGPLIQAFTDGHLVRETAYPEDVPIQVAIHVPQAKPEWLDIRASNLAGSVFDSAPVSWIRWRGFWGITSKWKCDPGWTYMGVWSEFPDTKREAAGIWTRDSFYGDQDLQFYIALKDMFGGDKRYVRRDMNFAFCGDGKSLESGYCILFGGFDNRGTQLLRRGELIRENRDVRFPRFPGGRGGHQDIHWRWWYCRIIRRQGTIRFLIDNKEVLSYKDPDPLPGGHVGLWTLGNGLMVTRTRFTWQRSGSRLTGFDIASPGLETVGGWTPFPEENPVTLEEKSQDKMWTVKVINSEAGGHFAVVMDRKKGSNAPVSFRYRVPADVTIYSYIWNIWDGKPAYRPVLKSGFLRNDGEWHRMTINPGTLKDNQKLVLGCWEEDGYICAGLGGNRLGASYYLDMSPLDNP